MDDPQEKRLALGVLGPKRTPPEFGKGTGFSSFSFENEQKRFAFMQDGNKSSFAFASQSQGKDGSQQAFGFKASSKDDSFKFKMASSDGNHQFGMKFSASGGQQAFSMSMQHGDKGGFAMNLGFGGAKGQGQSKGPGLALQSGKNGLSMMLDLSGGKGGKQDGKGGAGMNMSINMGGGKGGSSINIGLGGQGGGGFAMSIGFGGKQSAPKK